MKCCVEGLGKVQRDGVRLVSSVQFFCQTVNCLNELGLTGSVLSEPMLSIIQTMMFVEVDAD